MTMRFSVSELSQRGGRAKNEDRSGYTQTEESALFILADGMGGHPDGEMAAEIAVRETIELFHRDAKPVIHDPALFLSTALRTAHHRIIRYGTEQGLMDVPRTTAVACVLQKNKIWWAHCGDSRLYLVRQGKILICTTDHSYIKSGRQPFKMDGTLAAVNRSMLYACLGSATLPMIEVSGPFDLVQGDRILQCSDGLWGSVDDEDIRDVLSMKYDIAKAVSVLVAMALDKAGKSSDNVTVIGVEWQPHEMQPEVSQEQVAEPVENEPSSSPFANKFQFDDEIDQSINEINEALQRTNRSE
ncbi:Serine/threonine phosphatase stp [Saezia sanguinis]|jgi:serine/threonine protein phosphatase PrpC|uniref:Serine/threonine phosphatase stp n=1 Tax=Saezia sanguinis TaxID=1965230 RepID=A0A433SHJ3_9BURK|nr:Serine/threonine phosphatase stp [Saezia sanguinis]